MGDSSQLHSPVVLVTGFGPFGHHKVNASWEAVKHLTQLDLENELKIKLVIAELPVEYDFVETEIPKLWKAHNPQVYFKIRILSQALIVTTLKSASNSRWGVQRGFKNNLGDSSQAIWLQTDRQLWQTANYGLQLSLRGGMSQVFSGCVFHQCVCD